MSGEVERVLKLCELPQHHAKFVSAGIRSLADVKQKPSLIKALLPRTKDYNAFLAALNGRTTAAAGRTAPQPPQDAVLDELTAMVAELKTDMRKASIYRADTMIAASPTFPKQPSAHHLDARTARLRVLKASGKLEQNKAMLSIANSGLTTHRRFLELSRTRQAQQNRGGDPLSISALDEELDTLRSYVQDVLVNLGEQRKQRDAAFHEDPVDQQEEPGATAALETLRELLKEKEQEIVNLNKEMDNEFALMQAESIRFADEKERLEEAVRQNYTAKQVVEGKFSGVLHLAPLAEVRADFYETRCNNLSAAFSDLLNLHITRGREEVQIQQQQLATERDQNRSLRGEVSTLKKQLAEATANSEAELAKAQLAASVKELEELKRNHSEAMDKLRESHEGALRGKDDDAASEAQRQTDRFLELQRELDTVQTQLTLQQLESDSRSAEVKAATQANTTLAGELDALQGKLDTYSALVNCDKSAIAIQTLSPRSAEQQAQPAWLKKIQQPTEILEDVPLSSTFSALVTVLEEKGFDPAFAGRHARRLSAVECIAANAAEMLPISSGERSYAAEIATTIRTQVQFTLDRHGSVVDRPVSTPSRINEEDGEAAYHESPVPSGLPLIDATFISSWRILEGIVGHRMPKNAEQAEEIPLNEQPASLNDEVLANLFETMRVVRGLRAELFCQPPAEEYSPPPTSGFASTASPSKVTQPDDYGKKTPIEIKGRRRQ